MNAISPVDIALGATAPGLPVWIGALTLMMRYGLTGCTHAGQQAADLIERIADHADTDSETRLLALKMCDKLRDAMASRS
ncbi:MAG TPA: hypothetical protein VJ001_17690 [Rhodocyclaceae bacterium]|nr:hypothetical protein [Rhodocyclaceae bacterium]